MQSANGMEVDKRLSMGQALDAMGAALTWVLCMSIGRQERPEGVVLTNSCAYVHMLAYSCTYVIVCGDEYVCEYIVCFLVHSKFWAFSNIIIAFYLLLSLIVKLMCACLTSSACSASSCGRVISDRLSH